MQIRSNSQIPECFVLPLGHKVQDHGVIDQWNKIEGHMDDI